MTNLISQTADNALNLHRLIKSKTIYSLYITELNKLLNDPKRFEEFGQLGICSHLETICEMQFGPVEFCKDPECNGNPIFRTPLDVDLTYRKVETHDPEFFYYAGLSIYGVVRRLLDQPDNPLKEEASTNYPYLAEQKKFTESRRVLVTQLVDLFTRMEAKLEQDIYFVRVFKRSQLEQNMEVLSNWSKILVDLVNAPSKFDTAYHSGLCSHVRDQLHQQDPNGTDSAFLYVVSPTVSRNPRVFSSSNVYTEKFSNWQYPHLIRFNYEKGKLSTDRVPTSEDPIPNERNSIYRAYADEPYKWTAAREEYAEYLIDKIDHELKYWIGLNQWTL